MKEFTHLVAVIMHNVPTENPESPVSNMYIDNTGVHWGDHPLHQSLYNTHYQRGVQVHRVYQEEDTNKRYCESEAFHKGNMYSWTTVLPDGESFPETIWRD